MRYSNHRIVGLFVGFSVAGLSLLAASRAAGQGAPAVTLSSAIVNFSPQLATTTSAAQTVTLTNSGDAPLMFAASGITLAGQFAQTNTCPTGSATLAAGSTCTFSITFSPSAGGPAVGLIEIMDNAAPATQAITLSGVGEAFSLSASPTSGSVMPGGSANYTITVTPIGGFNSAVSFSCGSLVTGVACSFTPGSVTPDGSSTITTSLKISTTASGSAPGGRTRPAPPAGSGDLRALLFIVAVMIALAIAARSRWIRSGGAIALTGLAVVALLAAALVTPGCGGGGSSSTGSSGTPTGNYTVLVTGSTPAGSSTLTSPVSVTLAVQ